MTLSGYFMSNSVFVPAVLELDVNSTFKLRELCEK